MLHRTLQIFTVTLDCMSSKHKQYFFIFFKEEKRFHSDGPLHLNLGGPYGSVALWAPSLKSDNLVQTKEDTCDGKPVFFPEGLCGSG